MSVLNTHEILADLVSRVQCKPGWSFAIVGEPKRLSIMVRGWDSAQESSQILVQHFFPIPQATYNEATWRRWIFECCRGVENHELGEWFKVDGHQPFAPLHGPGEDPYTVHEFRPEKDALTTQDGSMR